MRRRWFFALLALLLFLWLAVSAAGAYAAGGQILGPPRERGPEFLLQSAFLALLLWKGRPAWRRCRPGLAACLLAFLLAAWFLELWPSMLAAFCDPPWEGRVRVPFSANISFMDAAYSWQWGRAVNL